MIYLLLLILIIIIVAAIMFSIIKSLVKTAISVAFIAIILLFLLGIMFVYDTNSLAEPPEQGRIYLLGTDDLVIQGFSQQEEEIIEMNTRGLDEINNKYQNGEIQDVLQKGQELIFIKSQTKMNSEEIQERFNNKIETHLIFVKDLKDEKTIIYPTKFSFKIVKYVPSFIINLMSKIIK
jgi:hypothetical protein